MDAVIALALSLASCGGIGSLAWLLFVSRVRRGDPAIADQAGIIARAFWMPWTLP